MSLMLKSNKKAAKQVKRNQLLIVTGTLLLLLFASVTTGIVVINAIEPEQISSIEPLSEHMRAVSGVCVDVDYINESIHVTKGPQNSTKFYYSQDKKKTWELIENPNGILDLAVFMKSSDNILYFKGDKDEEIVELKIPKEDNSLKVSYYVENGVGKLKFVNNFGSLQYRKGTNGNWKTYITDLDLRDYEINGYTLQFRVMATTGKRAGRIVNVRIPRRQSAPTIKVDYSKFILTGFRNGTTQYRIAGSNNWITFVPVDTKTNYLDLQTLLLPKGTAQNTLPIPAAAIEVRNVANKNKVGSGIKLIDIHLQPTAPVTALVTLDGNKLTFTDASRYKPYEYFVLHAGEAINLKTAKWKKVTTNKPIEIKKVGTASPVPGDVIYFRTASIMDAKTKIVTPASMYTSITITAIILPPN